MWAKKWKKNKNEESILNPVVNTAPRHFFSFMIQFSNHVSSAEGRGATTLGGPEIPHGQQ